MKPSKVFYNITPTMIVKWVVFLFILSLSLIGSLSLIYFVSSRIVDPCLGLCCLGAIFVGIGIFAIYAIMSCGGELLLEYSLLVTDIIRHPYRFRIEDDELVIDRLFTRDVHKREKVRIVRIRNTSIIRISRPDRKKVFFYKDVSKRTLDQLKENGYHIDVEEFDLENGMKIMIDQVKGFFK